MHTTGCGVELSRRHQQAVGQDGGLGERHLGRLGLAPAFEEAEDTFDAAAAAAAAGKVRRLELCSERIVKVNLRPGPWLVGFHAGKDGCDNAESLNGSGKVVAQK